MSSCFFSNTRVWFDGEERLVKGRSFLHQRQSFALDDGATQEPTGESSLIGGVAG